MTENFTFVIDIPSSDGRSDVRKTLTTKQRFGVNVRPYCHEFLRRMSKVFELAIFTASTKPYCDPIVNRLDHEGLIAHRLYRCHCTPVGQKLVKDLATLKNRRKEDIIIIDNLVNSFSNDLENGIPILPYYRGDEDYELKYLADVLERVGKSTNCMEFISENFQLHHLYNRY